MNAHADGTSCFHSGDCLLNTWMGYVEKRLLTRPVVDVLNLLRRMHNQTGDIGKKLHLIKSTDDDEALLLLCDHLLNYDEAVLRDPELILKFDHYLIEKVRAIHQRQCGLMTRTQQLKFVAEEEQKGKHYIRFRFKASLEENDLVKLKRALGYFNIRLGIMHYANKHKISIATYGVENLSYTWLELDLADRLTDHLIMKELPKTYKGMALEPDGIAGTQTLVFNSCKPFITILMRVFSRLRRQSRREKNIDATEMLLKLLPDKNWLQTLDFGAKVRAEFQTDLLRSIIVFDQYIRSGELICEDTGRLTRWLYGHSIPPYHKN
jgi:hypothetical protein